MWKCFKYLREQKTPTFERIGLPGDSNGKEFACNADLDLILGQEDALEKGMATHSSILAWRNIKLIYKYMNNFYKGKINLAEKYFKNFVEV